MVYAVLIVLGLCLGSFTNALAWRIYEQDFSGKKRKTSKKLSIWQGRSMCPHCRHQLSANDLIPVLSWLELRGHCRYCQKKISWQYPLIELAMVGLFVASYVYWPYALTGAGWVPFLAWLIALVPLMAMTITDIRWMLLPNRLVFPLIALAVIFLLGLAFSEKSPEFLWQGALSASLFGGIFSWLYQFSKGKWLGGGDVKLAFALGLFSITLLKTMFLLFVASVLGLFTSILLIIVGKQKSKQVPFGPFLILALIITVLFGADIVSWYEAHFLAI